MLFPKEKLSVQVHPDDALAQRYGEPRGKTECWYALDAKAGAEVALGIKPGPRAAEVGRLLAELRKAGDEDGLLRVPVEALFPASAGEPVPLRAVCFLDGFAGHPELNVIPGDREALARMQPLASSLGPSAASCVFEMIRLLGGSTCYRLRPGDPDETAVLLEEVFTRS